MSEDRDSEDRESKDREKELLRLAEAVSDGTPVDWERERGSHPGIKEPLEHLAVLDRVRQVHEESSRVLMATGAGPRREGGTVPAGPAVPAGAPGQRRRPWVIWIAIALVLAAAALALFVYNNAAKAAM